MGRVEVIILLENLDPRSANENRENATMPIIEESDRSMLAPVVLSMRVSTCQNEYFMFAPVSDLERKVGAKICP